MKARHSAEDDDNRSKLQVTAPVFEVAKLNNLQRMLGSENKPIHLHCVQNSRCVKMFVKIRHS